LRHLILPAMPLVVVLFGYIARIVRAGTLAALDADYTRTALLKGLPWRVVLFRHVLRNALLPTVTVIAGQVSYLLGGLVVVETLFRYPGIGSLILTAARGKDYAMLEAGILVVGAVFIAATLAADLLVATLDPRQRDGAKS
jgi:peptide/nickel transport system permease protein